MTNAIERGGLKSSCRHGYSAFQLCPWLFGRTRVVVRCSSTFKIPIGCPDHGEEEGGQATSSSSCYNFFVHIYVYRWKIQILAVLARVSNGAAVKYGYGPDRIAACTQCAIEPQSRCLTAHTKAARNFRSFVLPGFCPRTLFLYTHFFFLKQCNPFVSLPLSPFQHTLCQEEHTKYDSLPLQVDNLSLELLNLDDNMMGWHGWAWNFEHAK